MKLYLGAIVVLLPFLSVALRAQSVAPEVFVHVGTFGAGSDEGRIGRAASLGGGFDVPLSNRFAAELDIQTSEVTRFRLGSLDNFYRTRRTLVIPSLIYRRGGVRAYGFIGMGIGAEFTDSVTREDNFRPDFTPVGWIEIKPRVFEIDRSDVRRILFAPRAGFVAFPVRRVGVRSDFYIANWHVGARIGIVYRLD
jgi:hypothetical protein